MALFRVGPCVLQVILTDCYGHPVPDLEQVMEDLVLLGAVPRGLRDCDAMAILTRRAVEEATGCEARVEPFPWAMGPEMHRIMALRLG
ncbi:hypothetical protein Pyrde_0692 [Pyrodictium delaneyi]|uniref:Uncharacterized protein n=1 Tax=Pyrodictium delaneyi TaxID=1273541 RepID=A0A0P0N2Q7_9CREN|nr:hypothetical protein [Pyrodictium delaneyi]ALL00742.1 hypothetical protein Pyrde_0692 [Pyrodictium delaneyi]OWJ55610.1 hypothetical protein Pdsh_02145 [Pyrodictium delaneyi]